MTVFSNSVAGKQVFPIDYGAEVSQRLVDASHSNDHKSAYECMADPFIDINFIGTVSLKAKKTEILLHDESANEVCVEFEEFKTEVTALFLAAHNGNEILVRKLLVCFLRFNTFYMFVFVFSFNLWSFAKIWCLILFSAKV